MLNSMLGMIEVINERMNNEKSKWLCCPICGAKTRTKVFDSTVLIDFPLFCRECQKEIVVTLVEKRISYQENNNEPDR